MYNYAKDHITLYTDKTMFRQQEEKSNEGRPSLEQVSREAQKPYAAFHFEEMLQSLHELFKHDREIASQAHSARCGICYLHFLLSELQYRDEGYYVCIHCSETLKQQSIPMLHKQHKI